MALIFKIAWRNLLRHKGKSIIIGVILFLAAFIMTLGSGIISGMDRGLELNIVNGFLGDIVIISKKEKSDNILFKMYGESIETITKYKDAKKILQSQEYIKDFIPVGKNMAMVLNEDEGDPGFAMTLGVDFEAYRKFFPDSFTMVEGSYPGKNEQGVIIPMKAREDLYDFINAWFLPEKGDIVEKNLTADAKENLKDLNIKRTAVFMGMSEGNYTSDIRLGVKGIMKFRALNTMWGHFSIMDIESYRKCLGYFSASDLSLEVSGDKKELLAMDDSNLDSMFGKGEFFVRDRGSSDISGISFKSRKGRETVGDIDYEAGIYNLIFIKLKKGEALDRSVGRLNEVLSKTELDMRAITWKKASGAIGSMAVIIKGALFTFVIFLFFVAVIIIVNTLSMAAIERTSEIGMMRAVGARKGFISGMFIGETAILSGLFGGAGIVFGIAVVNIIPLLHITSANDLVQLLYGGDVFKPYLSAGDTLVAVVQLVIVTFVTVVYPVRVAMGITPLDAISRE